MRIVGLLMIKHEVPGYVVPVPRLLPNHEGITTDGDLGLAHQRTPVVGFNNLPSKLVGLAVAKGDEEHIFLRLVSNFPNPPGSQGVEPRPQYIDNCPLRAAYNYLLTGILSCQVVSVLYRTQSHHKQLWGRRVPQGVCQFQAIEARQLRIQDNTSRRLAHDVPIG
jgi:hypothetical protein